jgi:hypothetical protein
MRKNDQGMREYGFTEQMYSGIKTGAGVSFFMELGMQIT